MPHGDGIEVHGTCRYCGGDKEILYKWRGKWYCHACFEFKQDSTKIKIDAIERPVDSFNSIVRRTGRNQ